MKLLFAIAVNNQDATNAERLLDHIHHCSGKKGHLLIAFSESIHDEMKARIRISASLAFETVHEMQPRKLADANAPKTPQINNVFRQVAEYVQIRMGWPFLWFEPDCTPTVFNWREKLFEAYDAQPMRYFGNRMKVKPKSDTSTEIFFMSRVGIYPHDAYSDLVPSELFVPVEIASGKIIQPKLCPTKMFQTLNIATEDDIISVREDALLVHGDKHGHLLKSFISAAPQPIKIEVQAPTTPELASAPRITRRMLREMKNGATS